MLAVLAGVSTAIALPAAAAGGTTKFSSTDPDTSIPDNQSSQGAKTITVSGLTGNITNVTVSLWVISNDDSGLDAAIVPPSAASPAFAYLFSAGVLSGVNVGASCGDTFFDDSASGNIDTGTAPYSGTFKPSPNVPGGPQPLSGFNGLTPAQANGDWSLDMFNSSNSDYAAIECWSIFITTAEDGTLEFDSSGNEVFMPAGIVSMPIDVSGLIGSLSKITISLWITHTDDRDLEIQLVSPSGQHVKLMSTNQATGQNMGTACITGQLATFSDGATNKIQYSAAPHIGSFITVDPLALFHGLSGTDLNGTWHLQVMDKSPGHTGSLHCWSMNLGTSALTVQPRTLQPPLPMTYNDLYFVVTNTSNDTVNNVTLTSTLPKGFADLRTDTSNFPDCTVHLKTITCHFASIAPHDYVKGGGMARTSTPTNGKFCFGGTAKADGVLPASKTKCFAPSHYTTPDHGTGYGVGKLAHNLQLKDQNGNTVSLNDFAGDYVLLQFTASWCGPSNQEVPQDRDEIANLNSGNVMGVPVVFLSVLINGPTPGIASNQVNATVWHNHFGLTSPVLYTQGDLKQIALLEHLTYSILDGQPVETFPMSVFIRPDGTIFDLRIGVHQPGDTTTRFTNDLP